MSNDTKATKSSDQECKNPHNIKCGYPLCPFYNKDMPQMSCPMPIQGNPCQGLGNPYEHYYGLNKPID